MDGWRAAPAVFRPLNRSERWGLVLLLAMFVLHSLFTGHRSLFLKRRHDGLGRLPPRRLGRVSGEHLYEVADGNGFHYIYPPLLAILLTPLADPPAGGVAVWRVPFAVSVFLMYFFSVLCRSGPAIGWQAAGTMLVRSCGAVAACRLLALVDMAHLTLASGAAGGFFFGT